MPITFHDATVNFSAEEWSELHEWQKELYRKVMKEIHQALISLGPIIAATVFSLQAKENGDLYVVDIQDSDRQRCVNPSASAVIPTNSPVPFWVKTEGADCLKDSQDSDRLESTDDLSPEHQAISFVLKEEEENYAIGNQGTGRGECSIGSKGSRRLPRTFKSRNKGTVHGIADDYVQEDDLRVKIVEVKPQDSDAESQNMFNEWNPETPEHHGLAANAKNDGSSHSEETEISRTLNRFEMNQIIHTQSKVQIKSEQVISKMNDSPQPGTQRDQLLHVGTENEKKVALRRNQLTPKGLAPYTCTECGKVFRKHSRLTCHLRVHFGEKPYKCIECGKGFNDNSNFKRHLRIHSGKKPYTCNTCGKDFTQANHLNVHERLHTGEKPHECPICGKLFAHDSSLSKHQLTHTGRKPFQCSVCCKSFRQRGHLNIHLRVHTGERPFQCTKCEKTFIVKKHLIKHQTTHIDMNPPYPV